MKNLPALIVFCLLVGAASAAEQPVRSRLCPDDLPEGVRLPPRPGCAASQPSTPTPTRRDFYDLGDGTTVQIGGRAGVEFGARR